MLELICNVFTDRDFIGTLQLKTNTGTESFDACAKSDPASRAPSPAPGIYRLRRTVSTTPVDDTRKTQEAYDRYGETLYVFEAVSQALPIVCLHGGDSDFRGRLFPTECGIRVSDSDLERISSTLSKHSDETIELTIHEQEIGFFEKFRKDKVSDQPFFNRYEDDTFDDITQPFMWYALFLEDETPTPEPFVGGGGEFDGGGASDSYEDSATVAVSQEVTSEASSPEAEDILPLIVNPFPEHDTITSTPAEAIPTVSVDDSAWSAPEPERQEESSASDSVDNSTASTSDFGGVSY